MDKFNNLAQTEKFWKNALKDQNVTDISSTILLFTSESVRLGNQLSELREEPVKKQKQIIKELDKYLKHLEKVRVMLE